MEGSAELRAASGRHSPASPVAETRPIPDGVLGSVLVLTLILPNPVFALRQTGLEESNPKIKQDLVASLTHSSDSVPAVSPTSFPTAFWIQAGLEEDPGVENLAKAGSLVKGLVQVHTRVSIPATYSLLNNSDYERLKYMKEKYDWNFDWKTKSVHADGSGIVFYEDEKYYYILSATHVVKPMGPSYKALGFQPSFEIVLFDGTKWLAQYLGAAIGIGNVGHPDVGLLRVRKISIMPRDSIQVIPLADPALVEAAFDSRAGVIMAGYPADKDLKQSFQLRVGKIILREDPMYEPRLSIGLRFPIANRTREKLWKWVPEEHVAVYKDREDPQGLGGISGGAVLYQGRIIGVLYFEKLADHKMIAISATTVRIVLQALIDDTIPDAMFENAANADAKAAFAEALRQTATAGLEEDLQPVVKPKLLKSFSEALGMQTPGASWEEWYANALQVLSKDQANVIRRDFPLHRVRWWLGTPIEDDTIFSEQVRTATKFLSRSGKSTQDPVNVVDLLMERRTAVEKPLTDDDVREVAKKAFEIQGDGRDEEWSYVDFVTRTAQLLDVRNGILWQGKLEDLRLQLLQRIPEWQREHIRLVQVEYPEGVPYEELRADVWVTAFRLFGRSKGNWDPLNPLDVAREIVDDVETNVDLGLPAGTVYQIVRAKNAMDLTVLFVRPVLPERSPTAGLEEFFSSSEIQSVLPYLIQERATRLGDYFKGLDERLRAKGFSESVLVPLSGSGASVSLESPPIALHVQTEWKRVMQEKFGGVPGLTLTDDPQAATFIMGDQEFLAQIKRQGQGSQAFFLQADSRSMDQITPAFLVNLMVYIQRERLPSGTTLVVGGLVYDDLRQTVTALYLFV